MKNIIANGSASILIYALLSTPMPLYNNETIPVEGKSYMVCKDYREENSTPQLFEINKRGWAQESLDVYQGIRDFTPEESELYSQSISRLFKTTGKTFFDM